MIWLWIFLVVFVIVSAIGGFIVIARKGRELRKQQPLPPPSSFAFVEWQEGDRKMREDIDPPFYFGRSSESNILLESARAEFEVCIFYHKSRFAFQTLPGAAVVSVNGEEVPAGYLWDGDLLNIAGRDFRFFAR